MEGTRLIGGRDSVELRDGVAVGATERLVQSIL